MSPLSGTSEKWWKWQTSSSLCFPCSESFLYHDQGNIIAGNPPEQNWNVISILIGNTSIQSVGQRQSNWKAFKFCMKGVIIFTGRWSPLFMGGGGCQNLWSRIDGPLPIENSSSLIVYIIKLMSTIQLFTILSSHKDTMQYMYSARSCLSDGAGYCHTHLTKIHVIDSWKTSTCIVPFNLLQPSEEIHASLISMKSDRSSNQSHSIYPEE